MSDRALVIGNDPDVFPALKRVCRALELTADSATDAQSAAALFSPKSHRVVFVDLQNVTASDVAPFLAPEGGVPASGPAVVLIRDRNGQAPDVQPLAAAVLDCIDKPIDQEAAKRRLARALGVMDLENGLRQTEAKLQAALGAHADADTDALGALERALEVEFARARIRNLPLTCLTIAGDPATPLSEYGKRIQAKLRNADQVFCVDDAELVVLLPGTDGKGAKKVVQTVRDLLQQGEQVAVGAATFPHADLPQAAILYRAANLTLVHAQLVPQGAQVSYFEGF